MKYIEIGLEVLCVVLIFLAIIWWIVALYRFLKREQKYYEGQFKYYKEERRKQKERYGE